MTHGLDSAYAEYNRVARFTINSFNQSAALNLHTEDLNFMTKMELTYMREALSQAIYYYRMYAVRLLDGYISLRMGLTIAMVFTLFFLYHLLYAPLIAHLQSDTLKTRAMLLIIPVRVMESVKSIRSYIRNHAVTA